MSPNLRSSRNVFWSNELLKVSTKNGANTSRFSFSIRAGIVLAVDAFFGFRFDSSSMTAFNVTGWKSKDESCYLFILNKCDTRRGLYLVSKKWLHSSPKLFIVSDRVHVKVSIIRCFCLTQNFHTLVSLFFKSFPVF